MSDERERSSGADDPTDADRSTGATDADRSTGATDADRSTGATDADRSTGAADTDRADDRLRMDLYELLHERAERERTWRLWRLAAGHLVVGVILAYAFVFDAWRFVALTPVLYGIVVMDGLRSAVRTLYIQRHLVELEAELSQRLPLASYVTRYGEFGTGDRIAVADVDLNSIPRTAQYLLVGAIYVELVAASLVAWEPLAATGLGFDVTRGVLLVGYGSFSVVFGLIVVVGYLHYERVHEAVESY